MATQRRLYDSSSSHAVTNAARDVGGGGFGGAGGAGSGGGGGGSSGGGGMGGGSGGELDEREGRSGLGQQLSKGSAAAEARVQRENQQTKKHSSGPNEFASSRVDVARSAPAVIVQDTLEMMRGFERAGFSASQAESIVRTVLATVKDSVQPLCTRADLDKHVARMSMSVFHK